MRQKKATVQGGVKSEVRHSKDTELQQVHDYLFRQPATATQVATALGIYRPNLCRRKRELEKKNRLWQVKRVICPITRHVAWLLTCDPKQAPTNPQTSLFEAMEGLCNG